MTTKKTEDRKGRTLKEFKEAYDKATIVPQKIKNGLRMLGQGWEYEVLFAKMCGVSLADMAAFRDQFADHVIALKESRRAWAGSASVAKAMREML